MKITTIVFGLVFLSFQSFAQMGMQSEVMGKMLDEATSVSEEVKVKLRSLYKKHMEERMRYNEQIKGLRMQLAEKLLDPKATKSDIKKLKKEYKKIQEKRMDASMNVLEEATKLLKPTAPSTDADKKLNNHLFHLLSHDEY